MRCPVCDGSDLSISSREGVEIDFCPQCRGVWLDRGELDKIIDRAGAALDPSAGAPRSTMSDDRSRSDDRGRSDRDDRGRSDRDDRSYNDAAERPYDSRRKRRRSFLDDLFEFD